ncbi:hypothetical protein DPEC_G00331540 [Dallia pectoralis]|uniref:Uncharacterized protein n=2 Tax=Dallia pectoralis TaxID=75939 RepID=A0ACC2F5U3_DALPE|nr:hypothetical protein DPEC_G00331460 [Dallia pectoralis]KAJ7986741.1 hypothetical protein DPEC_G00331540 [Dallia pectoralis]
MPTSQWLFCPSPSYDLHETTCTCPMMSQPLAKVYPDLGASSKYVYNVPGGTFTPVSFRPGPLLGCA